MAEPLLEARGLERTYRRGTEQVHALRGVDLALYPGELVALVGPSGSGKSSLLGLLAGWEPPDAGELTWSTSSAAGGVGGRVGPAGQGGRGVPGGAGGRAGMPGQAARGASGRPGISGPGARGAPGWGELATVPQALGLLEDLSVRENVALPVRLRLGPGRAHEGRTEELLGLFGLAELADRSPSETSLGQQQRAAVARALVLSPQLVLADEPSAHQDAAWVHDVFAALRQVVHDRDAACLVTTHDPEALRFADRVLHLVDGELSERPPDRGGPAGEVLGT
jgi:putative ABC transport system ATP-binding protein